MTTKAKPFGHLRMIEGSVLPHAKALHYSARPEITDSRKGDNLFQLKRMKANKKSFFRCLGSEPFAPVQKRKAPPNLDARRKRKFSRWSVQTDKPNELTSGLALSGPETPSPLFDEQLATISHRVALCPRERGGEKLHDPWVCVQYGEGLAISKPPLAQAKAFCFNFD